MFDEPRDVLMLLQRWYLERADGEWEHSYGVSLDTLDNPGWSLTIDLADTPWQDETRPRTAVERSEHDWVSWEIDARQFRAACGPTNLGEAVEAFLDVVGLAQAPGGGGDS